MRDLHELRGWLDSMSDSLREAGPVVRRLWHTLSDMVNEQLADEAPKTVLNESSAADFMTAAARRVCKDVPAIHAVVVIYAYGHGGNQFPEQTLASWVTAEGPGETDPSAVVLTSEQVQRFYQHVLARLGRVNQGLIEELQRLQAVKELADDKAEEITSAQFAKEFDQIFKEVEAQNRPQAAEAGAGEQSSQAPQVPPNSA